MEKDTLTPAPTATAPAPFNPANPHKFNNTHEDRDCINCGKPLSDAIHTNFDDRIELETGKTVSEQSPGPGQVGRAPFFRT